jgi:protein arginine kinase activator
MLCDNCTKNPASVHMTSFVKGQVKTVHLCPECAAKKAGSSVAGPSFNDFMSSFYEKDETDSLVCDKCGNTLNEFSKTGRLGCANCYNVFRESIVPVLKGVHMNVVHTGKHPGERVKLDIAKETAKYRKSALQKELKCAIATENFEEAAKLRDEIAVLDKEDK